MILLHLKLIKNLKLISSKKWMEKKKKNNMQEEGQRVHKQIDQDLVIEISNMILENWIKK